MKQSRDPDGKTAFVFSGQGAQQVNMGMDLYEKSPAAKKVWDDGDNHLQDKFGFSILEIVRTNPKRLTIDFTQNPSIRENYIALHFDSTTDSRRLFPQIHRESENYTFKFPAGLLFTTTFGQPAILLLEKALYCDAFEKGVVPDDCFFAGHSLGEYGAVISFTDFLTTAGVAELVFLHALITNQAVERDSRGLSGYGMLAANPSRVGKQFDESKFEDLVNLVEATSDGNLCQIVNFNVVDSQYVVAGGLVNLEVLTHTLNYLKENAETSASDWKAVLAAIQSRVSGNFKESSIQGKPLVLTRGSATIPLVGIDVPFHSKQLLSNVPSIRTLLFSMIKKANVFRSKPVLEGRYIPNLTGEPFSCSPNYVKSVFELTGSPVLESMLSSEMSEEEWMYNLFIELWAYQFASPVQWVATNRYLLDHDVRSMVELDQVQFCVVWRLKHLVVTF
ncbi:unnamed protein product [Aphanomyces euteiches]